MQDDKDKHAKEILRDIENWDANALKDVEPPSLKDDIPESEQQQPQPLFRSADAGEAYNEQEDHRKPDEVIEQNRKVWQEREEPQATTPTQPQPQLSEQDVSGISGDEIGRLILAELQKIPEWLDDAIAKLKGE